MNRSIFPICQRLFISLVFGILLALFNFYSSFSVFCEEGWLVKAVINNIKVSYSSTLDITTVQNGVNSFQSYVYTTHSSNFKLSVFKYLQPNGLPFPKTSPYDHYHLNLYIPTHSNLHFGFQFTHHLPKNYPLQDFGVFSYIDIFQNEQPQYILKDFRVYDLNFFKPFFEKQKENEFVQFLLNNREKSLIVIKNLITN